VNARLPQAPKGPLVKLLVEGFHSPCGMHSFGRVARSSINFDPHNQPIISLAPCPACQRAGEMGLPQAPKGPLVKLLVP
jgi:hypothetical protein